MKRLGLLFLLVALALTMVSGVQLTAAPKVFRLAEIHPPGYPTEQGDQEFARLVAEKTDGQIKIEVKNNGVLGAENDVVEQAKVGVIEFVRVSTSPVLAVYKPIGVLNMPYLFRDQAHMWKVLDGAIGKHFLENMSSVGLVGLTYFDAGARNFYTRKEVKGPKDLKGLKIRVQPNSMVALVVDALGAIATPMNMGDIYSALQTGVIDGAENNIPSWFTWKHYEVAKYFLQDGHTRLPEVLMVSKKCWDTLTEDQKVALREAAEEAKIFQIAAWNKAEITQLAEVKKTGAVVSPANIADFQAVCAPIYDDPKNAEFKVWVTKIKAVK